MDVNYVHGYINNLDIKYRFLGIDMIDDRSF